jgi:hypothetical protein
MENFTFSGTKYKLSSWENKDYDFPDEKYGEA